MFRAPRQGYGRYRLDRLIKERGRNAKLIDWLGEISVSDTQSKVPYDLFGAGTEFSALGRSPVEVPHRHLPRLGPFPFCPLNLRFNLNSVSRGTPLNLYFKLGAVIQRPEMRAAGRRRPFSSRAASVF